MKKIALSTLLAMLMVSAKAQIIVDETDINKLSGVKYCEILAYDVGLFKKKIIINVDYGQKAKFGEDMSIKDTNGKTYIFNSVIDALNFFEDNGWEFVSNYAVSLPNNGGMVYHTLLKRRK